jgi:hypothetical protein
MDKTTKNISSLGALDQEIQRLQNRTKKLERDLDERLQYFQDNSSSIIMKSVFPGMQQKNSIPGSLFELVIQNERFRDSVGKLATRVFDKVSDGLDYISEKLDKKTAE